MASNSKNNVRENSSRVDVDSVVLEGVLSVLDNHDESVWSGTMTELNSALVRTLGRKQSQVLPRSPSSLRMVLNRVVNRLRNRSVSVRFGRTTDHVRTRYVKFITR